MWSRGELKERAKNILRGNYLNLIVVCFVMVLFTMITYSKIFINNDIFIATNYYDNPFYGVEKIFNKSFFAVIIIIFIKIFFDLAIVNQIRVGGFKYIAETNKHNKVEIVPSLLWTLKTGNFTKVFSTMFFRDLSIALWCLLFVVPGIIKYYQYYFVPFILADNPSIDRERALEISKLMTDGEKMNIFILNISFGPWYLLLYFIPFAFKSVFLMPYTLSTDAQLYLTLKEEVIDDGFVRIDELAFSEY